MSISYPSAVARLHEAIRDGLGLSEDTEVSSIVYGETPEWDSVAHMQMVAALEAAYGIMLDTDDVIGMSDYSEIRRILTERYDVALAA